jgi:hypothetical protein
MKRLANQTVANRRQNRLVLNRETLRRLGAEELQSVAGATAFLSCVLPCNTLKQQAGGNDL